MGWGSFNQNSTGSFNQNLLGSRNQNTVGSHNQNVVGSQNQNAGGSFNQNASGSFNQNAAGGAELVMSSVRMGGGYPSGTGYFGGYGLIDRSDYATPANLGPIPWTLDFADGNGWPPFPAAQRFDPNALGLKLEWQTGDWDPGLRYWSLPFDPTLTEWLQDVDLASPAVMAAREFAAQQALWRANAAAEPASPVQGLIYRSSVEWMFRASDQDTAETRAEKRRLAWAAINRELQDLEDQLREDRDRYLAEAAAQSDGLTDYFLHFLGIDPASKPWTVQLLRCGAAIGHVMVMQYKATYKRVRPSTLCPGLVPPWGPPQHPAFPSGHSLVAHLYALLLLEIEPVHQRFGIEDESPNRLRKPRWSDFFDPDKEANDGFSVDGKSPLLWLAWRAARNRERIGLHYRSDSAASRRLAAGVWLAMLGSEADRAALAAARGLAKFEPIEVPSLHTVLSKARAEWPSIAWTEPACAPEPKESKAKQTRTAERARKRSQAGK